MPGDVAPHLIGGSQRDAVALAQIGDQVPVVDRGKTELGGGPAGPCEKALDFGQQGLAVHAGRYDG
jgi:hypothetical protein